jgi:predicted DNA-binding WGR domain protein
MDKPSLKQMLGIYEYHDDSFGKRGSHKFWEIHYDSREGTYTTAWGRVGARAQAKQGLSGSEALKKIQEKIGKGYHKVGEPKVKRKGPVKTRRKKEKAETIDIMEELRKI